jgi:hypothetical protein
MLPASPPGFDDQDLAEWLREAGKRRRGTSSPVGEATLPGMPSRRARRKSYLSYVLAALGVLAYLEYYYAGVLLQIYSLPRVIVFILVDGMPPPV